MRRILTINMGSTSSNVSVFDDDQEIFKLSKEHTVESLEACKNLDDEFDMRRVIVEEELNKANISLSSIDAIAARGTGVYGRYHSGAYIVDEKMANDARKARHHGLAIGTLMAYEWSKQLGIPAYLYDVVRTDEIDDIARISGMPLIVRSGATHTLNTRAVAREVAESMGKDINNSTFIMCHLGGGISTSLHKNGKIVDVTSIDEGTFSPDRCGRVPGFKLVDLCYSGKYEKQEIIKLMQGNSGMIAYLGTNDCREVEARIENGDNDVKLIYEAMAYQLAKDIGSLAAIACGKIDAIVLTGGIAYSTVFTQWVKDYVSFIAPVIVRAGSIEMQALERGINRVLDGLEEAKPYIVGKTVLVK